MAKVLVSDPIDQAGIDILSQVATVDVKIGLTPEQFVQAIPEYDALMIRSGSRITKEIIEAGHQLKIIGRAGVGVDNVDVPAATRQGIVVVNSPEGNTIAAAEHAIAMMLALSRYIPDANASVKRGEWDRKTFVGAEVYKKTLGVVGLGKIGSHVATAAKAMGMKLLAYDPFISTERAEQLGCRLVEVDILLQEADYITLHIPKTPETTHLINAEALAKMKPNARIINCARGGIIDEAALAEALKAGKIAGAALDVFEEEPLKESPLRALGKEIILTPHLGASTTEAQVNVAIDVAEQIRDVLLGLPARSAVNIPGLSPDILEELRPYMQLAETLGNLVGQLAGGRVDLLNVKLQGELATNKSQPLVVAALKGLLSQALRERVNYVNASVEAKERGIRIIETRDAAIRDYAGSLHLSAKGSMGEHSVTGALLGDGEIRITNIDEFPINIPPSSHMLFTLHRDMPGIIGKLGSLLGSFNVNIASMQVGRKIVRGDAVMVLSLDDPLPDGILTEITKVAGIRDAYTVTL
ncbi:MAG: D-3-phosphoglycerate dehydrogenase [Chroococcidiopsis cubana SAG 39.79]|jgi:D-3-phosphoglycerate dehydrogenase / 2-oxoglutarate reductase|uniref:D-3-phosphoglycerate dehydrogenase n=2 Tax=Chroococcidiopsis TaxID=54298 RepID=K9TUY8_CHRTP|nr:MULTISPECIES: phosphoglycerate dehydrogenase [Chroococcidiopsis]PSB45460.1 phosphoglycerate dehydrogenase [Cyanosarcina cf. burmensis CCALA 770]AFY86365.1 D-3-phosphoglycerate dehydrogenase [Chroococcidiopsis thermalis PCC 7203]MDZ4873621.1 D-3-phosphoglycerate dehydrogenase [Chroococcidiopsis cubana SAG 39.79]PSB63825.1 phosphoglycerate dehydrogenase [Chroococcidiopsis cubana CCALA 043]RUT11798.1 D-3-phosphoglycerate dehydrogenase [Chroococcidiopsis cubana SAG 39.79]